MRLRASLAACAVIAAGCGSGGGDQDRVRPGGSDEARIRAAYGAFNRALVDGDGKRFCELITDELRDEVLDSRAAVCPAVMEKRMRPLPEGVPMSTVKRVTITGDTADVAYSLGDVPDVDRMQMRKVAGDWLVDVSPEDDEPSPQRAEPVPTP